MKTRHILFSISVAALTQGGALADTVIHFKTNAPGSPESMAIKGDKVMISAPEKNGRFIMDTTSEKIVMINDQEKKYFEIDSNTIEQTASMMDVMRQTMLAQLQNLPEAQRKALEARLGLSADAPPPAPKVEVKPTASKIKVNGIPCTLTDIYTDNTKTAEACVATTKAAGISDADYRTMQKMFRLSKKLAEKSAKMTGPAAGKFAKSLTPELDGFPMQVRDLRNGNQVIVSKIETKKLTEKDFNPGRSYRKFNPMQEIQRMMGGQRPSSK